MPLPKFIVEKHDVENYVFCFQWSVIAALCPVKINLNLKSLYPHFNSVQLKYDGIKFPINLHDAPKLEQSNNSSIKVYGIDYNENSKKEVIVKLYLSHINQTHRN